LELLGIVGLATVPARNHGIIEEVSGTKTLAAAVNTAAFNLTNAIGVP
jgi:predicted MFS family arabinose efflux permease